MGDKCEYYRDKYYDDRIFGEDCPPNNAFYFFYLMMVLLWTVRPVENLILLMGSGPGSKALAVRVQFNYMVRYLPIVFCMIFFFVIFGMAVSFMQPGFNNFIQGFYSLMGQDDTIIAQDVIQFYHEKFWLWTLVPLIF